MYQSLSHRFSMASAFIDLSKKDATAQTDKELLGCNVATLQSLTDIALKII